jgi:hypothetical protein
MLATGKEDPGKHWYLVSSPHQQARRSNKGIKVAGKALSVSIINTTIGTAASAVGLIYHHVTPARLTPRRDASQIITKDATEPTIFNTRQQGTLYAWRRQGRHFYPQTQDYTRRDR